MQQNGEGGFPQWVDTLFSDVEWLFRPPDAPTATSRTNPRAGPLPERPAHLHENTRRQAVFRVDNPVVL